MKGCIYEDLHMCNVGKCWKGPKRAKTDLLDSGALHHMTTYGEQLQNFVSIMPKSIAVADKHYSKLQARAICALKFQMATQQVYITHRCPLLPGDWSYSVISRLVDASFHSHLTSCRIFDGREKVIGDIPQRNGLYQVYHSTEPGERLGEWQLKL